MSQGSLYLRLPRLDKSEPAVSWGRVCARKHISIHPSRQSVAAHVNALCRTSPDFKWTPEQMQASGVPVLAVRLVGLTRFAFFQCEEKFETDGPAQLEVCSGYKGKPGRRFLCAHAAA